MKIRLITFQFATVLMVLLWLGCSRDNNQIAGGEPMAVTLSMTGDFDVDVTETPITKAVSPTDVYGINIYYDKEGDGAQDDPYAYGLFDNVEDMSITMLSGHKYTVYCTLIKDGRNKLYFGQAFGNTYSGYAFPFQTNTSNSTILGNKFIIGDGNYLTGMTSGCAHMASTTTPSTGNATPNAPVSRYYGITSSYEPVHNGSISVYLKRVVFGAKFVVAGLKEGNVRVQCGDFFDKTYTADKTDDAVVYTYTDIATCWEKETPQVSTITLTYTSDRGTLWNVTKTQDLSFKRNVMTTVNVNMSPDLSGGLFELTEEALEDDNNIDMSINADGLIDVDVDPQN